MFFTLDALGTGQDGVISLINVGDDLLPRFAALGLSVGKTVKVVRRGRWAGPLHVRVGTTELIIRQRDACGIQLRPLLIN